MEHRVKFALKAKAWKQFTDDLGTLSETSNSHKSVGDKISHVPKPLNKPCWEPQTEVTLLRLFEIKLIPFFIVGTSF